VADRQRPGGVDGERHRVDVGERPHGARHRRGGDERRGDEGERVVEPPVPIAPPNTHAAAAEASIEEDLA